MNIFVLDQNPAIAAQYHCNKHVVKQIVETLQMLGSAAIRHGANIQDLPLTKKGTRLKGGYPNHPCTRWAGDSRFNYNWLVQLGQELCKEYTLRYKKQHFSEYGIQQLAKLSYLIPDVPRTPFAIAISDKSKCRSIPNFQRLTVMDKYRYYYTYDKPFLQYTNREVPHWIAEYQPK